MTGRLFLSLWLAGGAVLAGVSPAAATCREVVDRYGVSVSQCTAPGGEPATFVCAGDTCVVV